jgi:predicted DCC family thiol-disulfide oxidoreductase YuxK
MSGPTLYYDGDCGFCRAWIRRAQALTQGAVEMRPAQSGGHDLSAEETARAVWLITAEGKKYSGAEAVYRTLAYTPGSWKIPQNLYATVAPFKWLSDAGYAFVAAHRPAFARLTALLFGEQTQPGTYHVGRWLFLKLLALSYLTAFVSFWLQLDGLVGERGITPAVEFLGRVAQALPGAGKYWQVPTLLWLSPSVGTLHALCAAGTGLSVLLLLGFAQLAALVLLWVFYLSLCSVGGVWLSYQWDILLLEVGLAALLIAPWSLFKRPAKQDAPSCLGIFVLNFLLFKLMFSSGMVKLLSGDPSWSQLTALGFHYETQCLPTWIAWFVHHLPASLHKISTALMFVVELVLPFFIFAPRRPRMLMGGATILLMGLIALTGNYTFFNLLTAALALLLFDDAFFQRRLPEHLSQYCEPSPYAVIAPAPWQKTRGALAGVLLIASLGAQAATLGWRSNPLSFVTRALQPLRSVNNYGLFAVMTKDRHEILLEGTRDGSTWHTYEFRWKPGALTRAPGFVAPHQPRLDWQMWFAVLSPYNSPRNQWFFAFSRRLLEGSPEVQTLLAHNPFPEQPPIALRAWLYRYRFSDPATRRKTGQWWTREKRGLYCPVLSLNKRP